MTTLISPILIIAVFVSSLMLTAWFRRQALVHLPLDVPNSRSSHTIATPRGGGVAIVLSMLIALLILGSINRMAWRNVLSLCAGGTLTALIGFADDRGHVPPLWRLAGHFAAASMALAFIGGPPPLNVAGITVSAGWIGFVVIDVYLVWMLNLTNFMDGIDGIASVETITVCVSASILACIVAYDQQLWLAPALLASATFGFLMWNWPPAKIFMGDAGSGFLGLVLGTLSLQAGAAVNRLFWSWLILLGVFVIDASVTLIRRTIRGDKLYEAHRSHAYQHAAVRSGAHLPVTVAVGIINVCWLLPIALLVAIGLLDGFLGVIIAYIPLAVVSLRLKAGNPSTS